MATIGTLAVNLVTRTAGFSKPLATAESKLGGFVSKLAKINPVAIAVTASLAAAAAATVALNAVVDEVGESFERLDKLAKTSDKLGIDTESLQVLQDAAELSGVSVQTLEKSLQKMVVGISEAARGTGEAKVALDELGLSAKDLENLGADAAFGKIADAMNQVENSNKKLNLTTDIFGQRGADMVNVLAGGSAGLVDIREKMERFGLLINRVDANKVEAANDAITDMGRLWEGVGNTIAVEVAPAVELTVRSLIEAVEIAGSWAGTIGEVVANLTQGSLVLSALLEALNLGTAPIADALADFEKAAESRIALAKLEKQTLKDIADQLEENNEIQSFAKSLIEQTRTPLEELDIQLAKIQEAHEGGLITDVIEQRAIDDAYDKWLSTFDEPVKVKIDPVLQGIQDEVDRIFAETRTPMENFQAEAARLQELVDGGFLDFETATRAFQLAEEKLDSLTAEKDEGDKLVSGPAALRKGSSEAFSAILAAGRQNDKPQQQTAQNTKATADEIKTVRITMGDMLAAIEKQNSPKPVSITGG